MTTVDARARVLREALDQYVANLRDHLESAGDYATAAEWEDLYTAEDLLDEANAAFLARIGVTA